MKRLLIPAALMLGLATSAQAQLSIYGLLDASYGKSLASDLANMKADFHSGGDNGSSEGNSTSRIGFKGSMDVGSGVKMNFKLESGGIDSEGGVNGGNEFFRRAAWLGMSGSFGEVRLGRQDSVPFQMMVGYDFNGASNGVSALGYSGVGPWARGRQSRSLQYILPAMGGVVAQFGFVPKGNGGPTVKDVFSGGVKYSGGPISGGLVFQTKGDSASKDFIGVGGTYDLGVVKLMLGYADGGKIADGGTGAGPSVGVSTSFAGFTLGAQYSQNTDKQSKTKVAEAFFNKEVFKNTYAYVEAGHYKSSFTGAKATGYAAGVIFVF